jgi:hypothetical protein
MKGIVASEMVRSLQMRRRTTIDGLWYLVGSYLFHITP